MRFSVVSNGDLLAPTQPDAVVPWWSFTKTVLSAAALSLVRDGLIGLDEKLPQGAFTLRQLLRHQAGLADYGELAEYHAAVARGDTPWTSDEMLNRLDAFNLRYPPDTQWRYSNVGYLFVAQLLERLTGLSLQEALKERVLAPLAVPHVSLARSGDHLDGVCWGAMPGYDPGWVYHAWIWPWPDDWRCERRSDAVRAHGKRTGQHRRGLSLCLRGQLCELRCFQRGR